MATKMIENNKLLLTGTIATPFELSHEVYGEKFYITYLSVMRFSGTVDLIPVMVSERLVDIKDFGIGDWARVEGNYRSYNHKSGEKSHLILTAFARTFESLNEGEMDDANEIYIEGTVCKLPVYRKTPLGREIADLLIAVNRSYGKSDYIPCICWGRNARFANDFVVGDKVKLHGRVQSREYTKNFFEDGEFVGSEVRTTYELSCSKIERI